MFKTCRTIVLILIALLHFYESSKFIETVHVQAFLAAYVEEVASGGGQDLTAALLTIAFGGGEDDEEAVPEVRRKRAVLLLDKMVGRILERILAGSWGGLTAGQLAWLDCGSSVAAATAAKWAIHAIRLGPAL